MARKIIQITAGTSLHYSDGSCGFRAYGLCDDGTVWELYIGREERLHWKRYPDVPQSRKIVQIATASSLKISEGSGDYLICGLCDDGTVWELDTRWDEPGWKKLPDVPQCEEPT